MRVLLLAVLAIGAAFTASSSRAQTYDPSYPVCLYAGDWSGYYECRYTSLAQCAASASGRRAYCVTNPYFAQVHRRGRRVY